MAAERDEWHRRSKPTFLVAAFWLWLLAGPGFAVLAVCGLIDRRLAPIVVLAAVVIGPVVSWMSLVLLDDVLEASDQ